MKIIRIYNAITSINIRKTTLKLHQNQADEPGHIKVVVCRFLNIGLSFKFQKICLYLTSSRFSDFLLNFLLQNLGHRNFTFSSLSSASHFEFYFRRPHVFSFPPICHILIFQMIDIMGNQQWFGIISENFDEKNWLHDNYEKREKSGFCETLIGADCIRATLRSFRRGFGNKLTTIKFY